MQKSSPSEASPESSSKSPLFTLGTHPLSHAPRGWERSASLPKKRKQRKGTRVWKRQPQEEKEALVSAQLLNDLASSLRTHAAKRQKTGQIPAVPAAMQTEVSYTSTLSDAPNSIRKRKPISRRKSTQGVAKASAEGSYWLSPTKQPAESDVLPDIAYPTADIDTVRDTSFLNLVDVSERTMFDKIPLDRAGESDADSDDATSEFAEDEDGDSANEMFEVDDDDSSEVSEDDERTGRLADAGNTGVIRLNSGKDFDELESDDAEHITQNSDMSPMQVHVASLLKGPPESTEAVMEDRAVSSYSTSRDETPEKTPGDSFISNASPTPSLGREDTTSTVAFEDLDVSGLLFGTEPTKSTPTKDVHSSATKQTSQIPDVSSAANSEREPVGFSNPLPNSTDRSSLSKREDRSSLGEESADELDSGSPTQRTIILSPRKEPTTADLAPTRFEPESHISDDTTCLNDFLQRVRSQAAARAQELARTPVKISTPRQSPRKALGILDANSPSPSPMRVLQVGSGKENLPSKPKVSGSVNSPVKSPKTPAVRTLLSGSLDSPETPDELSSEPPPLPPPVQFESVEDGPSARRSARSRLPALSRLPMNAPSSISLRRADGEPPLLLHTEAQTLARTTAANTRRNKGGARFPKQVIEILESKNLSPVKSKGTVKNKKGRNVDWDHRLVYFLEDTGKEVEIDADGKLVEKENGKEVRRKVRIVKGEKVTAKEDDAEVPLKADDSRSRKPDQIHSTQNVAKAPRRIKSISTQSLAFEIPNSASTAPSEQPRPSLAKPRRAQASSTLAGLKSTPAVRRMLSVEIGTPVLPAAKRRGRPTT